MFLTLSAAGSPDAPATDLGFLLHKHPERVHRTDLAVGAASVFYPRADEDGCTAALLLEVDPVGLVRGQRGPDWSLGQYVNDRPYAASSLLAVALGRVFRTALNGRCDARPELVDRRLALTVDVPVLPCRGGTALAVKLFAPLGWEVAADPIPADDRFQEWGDSRYVRLRLAGRVRVADALSHLYVLLPVLDAAKHYWVSTDEVDKLVRAAGGWLGTHPERRLVTHRYLAHRRALVDDAVARLEQLDGADPDAAEDQPGTAGVAAPGPRAPKLVELRTAAVADVLRRAGVARVVDAGCGEGRLLGALLSDPSFTELLGVDVSTRALAIAERRLRLDRLPPARRDRIRLVQSSLTYRDARLSGWEGLVLSEVVEHLDPPRLPALVRNVFGHARPRVVVITTPNAEHNVRYETLPAGSMRHTDHRFEWTRAEFASWAGAAAAAHGYDVAFEPVGEDDPEVGPPTQLAVLTRREAAA